MRHKEVEIIVYIYTNNCRLSLAGKIKDIRHMHNEPYLPYSAMPINGTVFCIAGDGWFYDDVLLVCWGGGVIRCYSEKMGEKTHPHKNVQVKIKTK